MLRDKEVAVFSSPVTATAAPLPLPTRIAFIGNYLPRQCGIATFTTDLCTAIAAEYGSGRLFAIPVNDPESSYQYPEQVRLELAQEDRPLMSEPLNSSTSTVTTWSACNMNTASSEVLPAVTYCCCCAS
jgi:hypothetical protein